MAAVSPKKSKKKAEIMKKYIYIYLLLFLCSFLVLLLSPADIVTHHKAIQTGKLNKKVIAYVQNQGFVWWNTQQNCVKWKADSETERVTGA